MEKYKKILKAKQKQKRNESVKKITLSVALSAVTGALSALFIAPKSEEINKSLIKAKDAVKDKVNTSIEFGKEKVKNIVDVVEKKIEKTDDMKENIEKKADDIMEDIEEGKEELDKTKNDIKKDIKK